MEGKKNNFIRIILLLAQYFRLLLILLRMKSKFFIRLYRARHHFAKRGSLTVSPAPSTWCPYSWNSLSSEELDSVPSSGLSSVSLTWNGLSCNMYKIHFSFHLDLCQTITWSKFPGGSVVKNPLANARDAGSILGSEEPLEKQMATTPVFLAGKSQGQGSLERLQSMGSQESDTTYWLNNNHNHFIR